MRSITQISSGSQNSDVPRGLKEKLTQLHVGVTPSPLYYDTDSLWQTYSTELRFYKSIAKSSFHIVNNDAPLREPAVLQTLYAMYKKRPIISIGRSHLHDTVSPELQKIFIAHMRQMQAANLTKLEFAELSFFLNRLKHEVNYRLTAEESTVIATQIRHYFYSLVERGMGEMQNSI